MDSFWVTPQMNLRQSGNAQNTEVTAQKSNRPKSQIQTESAFKRKGPGGLRKKKRTEEKKKSVQPDITTVLSQPVTAQQQH